ncbi:MAG: hypothetical protein WC544_04120 [Patescibacteria group bacterium]
MTITKPSKVYIVSGVIVGLAASLVFSYVKPVTYDTSISFSINRINRQDTVEYQYDGYYAIQASDLFSQTVMSWFMTPSVLLEIYDQAKIDPQINSLTDLTSRFKTKKYSPQNIVVQFTERDQDTADKISQAIINTVEQKSSVANQTSDQQALFDVQGATPVTVEHKPVLWLNVVIGIFCGFFVGFSLAYALLFSRQNRADQK